MEHQRAELLSLSPSLWRVNDHPLPESPPPLAFPLCLSVF